MRGIYTICRSAIYTVVKVLYIQYIQCTWHFKYFMHVLTIFTVSTLVALSCGALIYTPLDALLIIAQIQQLERREGTEHRDVWSEQCEQTPSWQRREGEVER